MKRWNRLASLAARAPFAAAALVVLVASVALVGGRMVSGTEGDASALMEAKLLRAESVVRAREGELEAARMEVARLQRVLASSAHYRIPADLAASIHEVAVAEGVDPKIAFGLVQTESNFLPGAISPKGAVGLTQVMPQTALELDPTLSYGDLFERHTNLSLGFRYLRQMLERYDQNLRLALLAYNRGPTAVDSLRAAGADPGNGYSRRVIRSSVLGRPVIGTPLSAAH